MAEGIPTETKNLPVRAKTLPRRETDEHPPAMEKNLPRRGELPKRGDRGRTLLPPSPEIYKTFNLKPEDPITTIEAHYWNNVNWLPTDTHSKDELTKQFAQFNNDYQTLLLFALQLPSTVSTRDLTKQLRETARATHSDHNPDPVVQEGFKQKFKGYQELLRLRNQNKVEEALQRLTRAFDREREEEETQTTQHVLKQLKQHEIVGPRTKHAITGGTPPPGQPFDMVIDNPVKKRKVSRFKKLVAAGAAALSFLGLVSPKPHTQEGTNIKIDTHSSAPQQDSGEEKKFLKQETTKPTISVSDLEQIRKGGSFWNAAAEKVEDKVNEAEKSIVNPVHIYAAFENKTPKPDAIEPDNYKILNDDAIEVIADEIEHPSDENASVEDQQFAADLKAWNTTSQTLEEMVKDPEQQARFQRIASHLKLELQEKTNIS